MNYCWKKKILKLPITEKNYYDDRKQIKNMNIITYPQKYWLVSDTHFNHKRILEFCKRPFNSIEEHDETLIKNWNETVEPKDWVYHLGDFGFFYGHTPQKLINYTRRLNGHIVFVRGNHDKQPKREYDEQFNKCYHSGFASVKIEKEKYELSHYPMLSWNGRYHGRFHFFGHIHSGTITTSIDKMLPIQKNSWDCGVDNNDYRPILLQKACEKAKKHEYWKRNWKESEMCNIYQQQEHEL